MPEETIKTVTKQGGDEQLSLFELMGDSEPMDYFNAAVQYNIDDKRRSYEIASASMDTETALDATAVGLGFMTFLNSTSYTEMGLSSALLGAAVFSFVSVKREKEFTYDQYVTARAIKMVADKDNGIDAKDLLPIFAMTIDRKPEDIDPESFSNENSGVNGISVKIGNVPAKHVRLIEAAKRSIQKADKEANIGLDSIGQTATRMKENLTSDFFRAGRSLTTNLRQTLSEATRAAGIAKTVLYDERKAIQDIKKSKTWHEEREGHKARNAAVRKLIEDDPQKGQEEALKIRERDIRAFYSDEEIGIRVAQDEQIKIIRDNVSQQSFTSVGVIAANTFMAVNTIMGSSELINAAQQFASEDGSLVTGAVKAATGLGYLGLAYMNVPPARALYRSVARLSDRFKTTGIKILEEQDRVREERNRVAGIVAHVTRSLTGEQDNKEGKSAPKVTEETTAGQTITGPELL